MLRTIVRHLDWVFATKDPFLKLIGSSLGTEAKLTKRGGAIGTAPMFFES